MIRKVQESLLGQILGDDIKLVCDKLEEFVVQKHETVLKMGQKCNGVFLVLRGTVLEKVGGIDDVCFQLVHKEGDIVGLQFLRPEQQAASLTGMYSNPYTVVSLLFIDCSLPKVAQALKNAAAEEILQRHLQPRLDLFAQKQTAME